MLRYANAYHVCGIVPVMLNVPRDSGLWGLLQQQRLCVQVDAIVFLVDALDRDRFNESRKELNDLLSDEALMQVPRHVQRHCKLQQLTWQDLIAKTCAAPYSVSWHTAPDVQQAASMMLPLDSVEVCRCPSWSLGTRSMSRALHQKTSCVMPWALPAV